MPHLEGGDGSPILFLHGWSVDASFFSPQMALAKSGFRVIAPDLPGHGAKRSAPAPENVAALSDALADLLAQTRLVDVTLVGWSMGAAVALDHLARHGKGRIARLAILDMAPCVANGENWQCGLAQGQSQADMLRAAGKIERSWPKAAARVAKSLFPLGAVPDPASVMRYEEIIRNKDPAIMAALWRSLAAFDARAIVAAPPVPISVILGGRSSVYPPELADWYRGCHEDVAVTVIEAAGHAPQIDASERINAILADFAKSIR